METGDYNPESILTDFEAATIKSVKSLFPNVVHKGNIIFLIKNRYRIVSHFLGCLFHFGQCLWRHIQTLGLPKKYQEDKSFNLNVRKFLALAFVPLLDVTKSFDLITADFDDDDADEFIDYFEKTWIGEPKRRGESFSRNICQSLISNFRNWSKKTAFSNRALERP